MTDQELLDVILRKARSHGDFQDKPVPEERLRAAHELMKWGPTSANSQPMRIVYLRSKEAREKLRATLSAVNLDKTIKAPMVALVAHDLRFWENLPRMFHNPEAINWFKDKGAHTEVTAFRNATLQGGYYLLALGEPHKPLERGIPDRGRLGQGRLRDADLLERGLQRAIAE